MRTAASPATNLERSGSPACGLLNSLLSNSLTLEAFGLCLFGGVLDLRGDFLLLFQFRYGFADFFLRWTLHALKVLHSRDNKPTKVGCLAKVDGWNGNNERCVPNPSTS